MGCLVKKKACAPPRQFHPWARCEQKRRVCRADRFRRSPTARRKKRRDEAAAEDGPPSERGAGPAHVDEHQCVAGGGHRSRFREIHVRMARICRIAGTPSTASNERARAGGQYATRAATRRWRSARRRALSDSARSQRTGHAVQPSRLGLRWRRVRTPPRRMRRPRAQTERAIPHRGHVSHGTEAHPHSAIPGLAGRSSDLLQEPDRDLGVAHAGSPTRTRRVHQVEHGRVRESVESTLTSRDRRLRTDWVAWSGLWFLFRPGW